MTVDAQRYELPSGIKTFTINEQYVVPEFDPALTIVDLGAGASAGRRLIRAYCWCYLDRLSLDSTVTSTKEKQKVNLISCCPQRVEIVRKLVSSALLRPVNLGVLAHISRAFGWIDQQSRNRDLLTLDSAKGLYQDYTAHLRHCIQLSNVGGKKADAIGYGHASHCQLGMALICAAATGLESSIVRSWAYFIPLRASGPSRAFPAPKTTEDEHAVAHALHTRFFIAFSDAILNNAPPPIVVELSDIGFEDVIFYSENHNSISGWAGGWGKYQGKDWTSYFYGRDGVFRGSRKDFDKLLATNGIEPFGNATSTYRSRQRRAKVFSEIDQRFIANMATRHAGYLLMAEAGSNASTLMTVDCSRVRLDQVLGASRLLAVKPRARYEQQPQFVDLRFVQTTWRRYLELREWMVQHQHEKGLEAPLNGFFLLRVKSKSQPYYPLNAANIMRLSIWPRNGPPLTTREARKHKTVSILEGSGGNMALASAMQLATPQTIEQHYAFKNVVEAAMQMSDYFEMQAKSAALRCAGVKPVRILGDGEDTSTGRCDAPKKAGPQLLEGFETMGIEPRCGAPLTCLFCTHFGIHAVVEDLVRLLTVKRWLEVQNQLYASNIDEGFAKYILYIERIDQVFEELPHSSEEFSELVRLAKAHFAEGKRDPYWLAKTNALLDLEAI